jgi:hypothetical protein
MPGNVEPLSSTFSDLSLFYRLNTWFLVGLENHCIWVKTKFFKLISKDFKTNALAADLRKLLMIENPNHLRRFTLLVMGLSG